MRFALIQKILGLLLALFSLSLIPPALIELWTRDGTFFAFSSGFGILCLAMLLERLEIFTLLVLLTPEFWRN